MTLVIVAEYVARPGQEDEVADAVRAMTGPSQAEPGCLAYQGHRHAEDPRRFMLYEQYVDEAALDAHRATGHYREHVQGRAVPALEDRIVTAYSLL